MKTIGVVMLSFLVFVLSANQLLAALDAVRVNQGEVVIPGVEYYILPVSGNGGGLTSGINRRPSLCPPDVVQEPFTLEQGRRVTIYPRIHDEKISLTNVDIVFSGPLYCRASHFMWKIDEFDLFIGQTCVTTEPLLENPGPNTLSKWFRLEKLLGTLNNYYKIMSCSVCEGCEFEEVCKDLGIFVDCIGVRRLCLSDTPLLVYFEKANDSTITTSSY